MPKLEIDSNLWDIGDSPPMGIILKFWPNQLQTKDSLNVPLK